MNTREICKKRLEREEINKNYYAVVRNCMIRYEGKKITKRILKLVQEYVDSNFVKNMNFYGEKIIVKLVDEYNTMRLKIYNTVEFPNYNDCFSIMIGNKDTYGCGVSNIDVFSIEKFDKYNIPYSIGTQKRIDKLNETLNNNLPELTDEAIEICVRAIDNLNKMLNENPASAYISIVIHKEYNLKVD